MGFGRQYHAVMRADVTRILQAVQRGDERAGASNILNDDGRASADYERAQSAAALAFKSDQTSLRFASTAAKAWTRLHHSNKEIEVWREHVDALRKDIQAGDPGLARTLMEYGRALLNKDRAKDAEPEKGYDATAAEWRGKLPQSPDGSAEG